MPKKRAASGHAAGSPEPPTSPLRAPIPPPPPTESPDPVTVSNPYNANDLKIACDDALRRYIARPDTSFSTVNRHTDVRLVLGWTSVLVAAATAGWGYKVEFEKAKIGLWIGFILSVFLVPIGSPLLTWCFQVLNIDDRANRVHLFHRGPDHIYRETQNIRQTR